MVLCSKNITQCYLYCVIPGSNILRSGRMLQISVILVACCIRLQTVRRRQYVTAESWKLSLTSRSSANQKHSPQYFTVVEAFSLTKVYVTMFMKQRACAEDSLNVESNTCRGN